MEIAELEQKITTDETFRNELFSKIEPVVLPFLQTKGYVVRNTEQETEFLTNFEKNQVTPKVNQLFEEKIGERIKQVHNQYDEDLFQLTGQRKDANEKTYEFLKKTYNGRLDETSKVWQAQVGQLTEKVQQKEAELEAVKADFGKKFTSFKVNSSLESELNSRTIAIPPTITDEADKKRYVDGQKEMMKSQLLSKYNYSDTENGIVFLKPDGTAVLNPKNAATATTADLLSLEFGVYFVDTSKSGGLGSGTGANGSAITSKDMELVTIKSIESEEIKRQKFAEYTAKNLLVRGSKGWTDAWKTVFQ